jgi:enterochelin esterase-like enzyme
MAPSAYPVELIREPAFYSQVLARSLGVDVYLPAGYRRERQQHYPVLLINDGQDAAAINLRTTLEQLQGKAETGHAAMEGVIAVAIHAPADRKQVYGIADQPDYLGRGSLAPAYHQFILTELLPFLHRQYRCQPGLGAHAFLGFSLGGLSAFDIAWHYPEVFGKVGVFSGSFWWRRVGYLQRYSDSDRIMHHVIRQTAGKPALQVYLQTGSDDETADRDKDGVIDSINDTLDIVKELVRKGYHVPQHVAYHEVAGGRHHPDTWAQVLPQFLRWAYGPKGESHSNGQRDAL